MRKFRIVEYFNGEKSTFTIQLKGWFFWRTFYCYSFKSVEGAEAYIKKEAATYSKVVREIEI